MSQGQRKLAAIMFTDMVGYTALSQKNETHALQLLEDHRSVVRPFFPKHNGREIKTIGDGFLVEFASALEAVRCAFNIQETIHELNLDRSDEKRFTLRIGVHLGDVIHSRNDVYGDTVNIASRIEPLANAGGICITEQVYDHIKNKFELPFSSIGKKDLWNIGEPVEVFRIQLPWEKENSKSTSLDVRRLAVLPFSSISPDSKDAYFADGMTEELITALSRLQGLRVIARASVDHFTGKERRISKIAQELQIGSVLEGSVRTAGDSLRVTVQLIDAKSEEHVWSENYDRKLDDVFAIQTDIAKQVAQSLKVKLLKKEKDRLQPRPSDRGSAYVSYLRGRGLLSRRRPDEMNQAKEIFESIIRDHPKFAQGYSGLADTYNLLAHFYVLPQQFARQKARELVLKAIELDPDVAESHATLGGILIDHYEFKRAEDEFRKAISLNPSYSNAHLWYSQCLHALGKHEQALEELRLAEEADPLSIITLYNEISWLGAVGRTEETETILKRLVEIAPDHWVTREMQAVSYYFKHDYENAVRLLSEAAKSAAGPTVLPFKRDLGIVYGAMGDKEDAMKSLRELISLPEETAGRTMSIAYVYAALGDYDEFFRLANQAYNQRTLRFNELRFFDIVIMPTRRISRDPRFAELFRRADLRLQADSD